MKGTQI